MNMMAQCYPYEKKSNEYGASLKMKSKAKLDNCWAWLSFETDPFTDFEILSLQLSSIDSEQSKTNILFAKIVGLADYLGIEPKELLSATEYHIYGNNRPKISLTLSNGEKLEVKADIIISQSLLGYYSLTLIMVMPSKYGDDWEINNANLSQSTDIKHRYIAQQLRTYNITKITIIDDIELSNFRSAQTLNAYFSEFSGTDSFSYYSSSPSSNVSSGPSASCKLGFVAVYSWGGIGCRVDDFRVVGAKGKDVEVNAIFEDVTDEYVSYGFVKKLTSVPYDDYTYDESFSVRGKVEELARLKRYNRAKFKVYIEVDVGNRCVYTSNAKYVTIYRDGDSWRSIRHK